jgi:hypothetical protein
MKWETILRRARATGVDVRNADVRNVGSLLKQYPQIAPSLAGRKLVAFIDDETDEWHVLRRRSCLNS